MVCGPEVALAVGEFEDCLTADYSNEGNTNKHHKQTKSKCLFKKNVENLLEHIEKFGNPFMEESKDLLVLHTKEIVCEEYG